MLKVIDLTKYYGKHVGAKNLNFTINDGDVVGFIGPNGAGKSTLIRSIVGLLTPNEGQVRIMNQNLKDAPIKIHEKVGYLPSEANFFPELTGKQTLDFFRSVHKADQARIDELVKRLDFDITKRTKDLSFGNRKKLGIIIALMHNPTLLIFDEPTSGLDPLIQSIFIDILKEENRKGVTIFLSSHIISEVEIIANKIIFIKNGEIIMDTTIAELKKHRGKRVFITPANKELKLTGLDFVNIYQSTAEYHYVGDYPLLLKFLGELKLENINIEDADLGSIVSNMYQGGE